MMFVNLFIFLHTMGVVPILLPLLTFRSTLNFLLFVRRRNILLTDECYPRLEVVFGGHDNFREPKVVEADEFIAVKGFKAKGKRLTTYTIETINALEPTRQPAPSQKTEEQETDEEPEILAPDHGKSEGDILDEMTGQMKLF